VCRPLGLEFAQVINIADERPDAEPCARRQSGGDDGQGLRAARRGHRSRTTRAAVTIQHAKAMNANYQYTCQRLCAEPGGPVARDRQDPDPVVRHRERSAHRTLGAVDRDDGADESVRGARSRCADPRCCSRRRAPRRCGPRSTRSKPSAPKFMPTDGARARHGQRRAGQGRVRSPRGTRTLATIDLTLAADTAQFDELVGADRHDVPGAEHGRQRHHAARDRSLRADGADRR
jgi:hypothetical protein